MSKGLIVLLLVLFATSTMVTVKPANAQTITKPSVPEFTVKYVDRSYDTEPTYGYDQYTGKNVIIKPSEHVDNRTIEITIKNQPFTPFTDENGNKINLLYNVQYKGSFGENWTSMFGERGEWAGTPDPYGTYGYPTQDSSSPYTTISFTLYWNMVQGQMDIQVEALEGYTTRAPDPAREHLIWTVYEYTFYGQESGWTNTQSVAYGGFSAFAPSPTSAITPPMIPQENSTQIPSTSNSQHEIDGSVPLAIPLTTFISVIAIFSAVIVALSLLLIKRNRKLPTAQ